MKRIDDFVDCRLDTIEALAFAWMMLLAFLSGVVVVVTLAMILFP